VHFGALTDGLLTDKYVSRQSTRSSRSTVSDAAVRLDTLPGDHIIGWVFGTLACRSSLRPATRKLARGCARASLLLKPYSLEALAEALGVKSAQP